MPYIPFIFSCSTNKSSDLINMMDNYKSNFIINVIHYSEYNNSFTYSLECRNKNCYEDKMLIHTILRICNEK